MAWEPNWIWTKHKLPEFTTIEYCYKESDPVLATDGKSIAVAYLILNDLEEPKWKLSGRDFYDFDEVTHWMPLPNLP